MVGLCGRGGLKQNSLLQFLKTVRRGRKERYHTQMNYKDLKSSDIKNNIEVKLSRYFGCTSQEASDEQMYKAVSMTIRDILTEKAYHMIDRI